MIRLYDIDEPWDFPLPSGQRVAIKPNLTFPTHKPGVTTTPQLLERVVEALAARDNTVFVIESDGGYGAWKCHQAMAGHGVYDICDRHGATAINLSESPARSLVVHHRSRPHQIPFPVFLDTIDVFISMPVPKVHCMTGVTLAMKNQWGLVPDPLRLNHHHIFDESILAINRRLPSPLVIGDGTYFLDGNGPLDGTPLRKDLVIVADSIGEFDRYLCGLMSVDPLKVPHLRLAVREGFVPRNLDQLEYDRAAFARHHYQARLHRTPRNWVTLGFFHSGALTRLMYTSQFGRALHRVYYALFGKPRLM